MNINLRKVGAIVLALCFVVTALAAAPSYQGEFSVAGFYEGEVSKREIYDFNAGWRFFKGSAKGAERVNFDDSAWEAANLPHGLEVLPLNASGGANYQGDAWYRKEFDLTESVQGKELFLHFEAIMGRGVVYVNGKKVKEFFGGYLPIHVNVTSELKAKNNVVAVFVNNEDDKSYPPGKDQGTLDFSYFGGIYRDSYLIATDSVYVTDSNLRDEVAGGGVFLRYENWNENSIDLNIDVEVANAAKEKKEIEVMATLVAPDGSAYPTEASQISLNGNNFRTAKLKIPVTRKFLWSPKTPHLHKLTIVVKSGGEVVDSVMLRTGVRKIEFKGTQGFFLNEKPYDGKLMGGNRHQDYAYIGNAVPNSLQWRDAKIMKEAGMEVVRSAHYPMDPAFMNACDELGLFVIVATPGWQFWNPAPRFERLVLSDIKNMVRRDRNHASVVMWEPILNETWYPASFAKKAHDTTHAEYPYQGCYTACDIMARGAQHIDIHYEHPLNSHLHDQKLKKNDKNEREMAKEYRKFKKPMFNREWGDNVDDWNSHNSPSRVNIGWGEAPMLTQLYNYSTPSYPYSTYNTQYMTPPIHVGGTLWHTFDHNRGYHPDPFWGGILTGFRQPKYSYFLFKSQLDHNLKIPNVESAPFIKILHEISPFSSKDVTVVSNCDEVRLTVFGEKKGTIPTVDSDYQMPHKPVIFKDAYDFMTLKYMHRDGKKMQGFMLAEGLIDGKVVVREKKFASLRLEKIELKVDYNNMAFTADGSDIIPVVATLTDKDGNPKRYSDEFIKFTVTGPAKMVGDASTGANPIKAEWGEAVALIQSTGGSGVVTVFAELLEEGAHEPPPVQIQLNPALPKRAQLFSQVYIDATAKKESSGGELSADAEAQIKTLQMEKAALQAELNKISLQEVERQQSQFEGDLMKSAGN